MTDPIPTARWDKFEDEVLEEAAPGLSIFFCGSCGCTFLPQYDGSLVYPDRFVPSADEGHDCECHDLKSPFDTPEEKMPIEINRS